MNQIFQHLAVWKKNDIEGIAKFLTKWVGLGGSAG